MCRICRGRRGDLGVLILKLTLCVGHVFNSGPIGPNNSDLLGAQKRTVSRARGGEFVGKNILDVNIYVQHYLWLMKTHALFEQVNRMPLGMEHPDIFPVSSVKHNYGDSYGGGCVRVITRSLFCLCTCPCVLCYVADELHMEHWLRGTWWFCLWC